MLPEAPLFFIKPAKKLLSLSFSSGSVPEVIAEAGSSADSTTPVERLASRSYWGWLVSYGHVGETENDGT